MDDSIVLKPRTVVFAFKVFGDLLGVVHEPIKIPNLSPSIDLLACGPMPCL